MAILWGGFAYRHAMAFGETADISYLLVCLSETIAAVLFLFRTTPVSISTDPFDWFFGIAGALLPLLFAPASWGVLPAAKIAIVLGLVMQIAGLLSLNRSFAIVAARREIKTCGMYRYVRHPLYASYLVMFSGYVLTNTTPMNLMIYLITVGFLFVRIDREEKQLVFDQAYSAYQQRVTYRLIPFVF